MSTEHRVVEIFNDAAELSTSERGPYLDQACGEDRGLRAQVEELLAAHDREPGFLDEDPPTRRVGDVPGNAVFGQFGHYRLLEIIGRGGQGTVYRARDDRLGRMVALKVLSLPMNGSPEALRRFRREALALSNVDHSGICTVFEAGEIDGIPFIAMRYIEGESLAQRLAAARASKQTVPLLVSTNDGEGGESSESPAASSSSRDRLWAVIHFFEEAARALHVAHEAGLIHRDIKPSNIMIDRDGRPVIVDFGLVRSLETREPSLTRTGARIGTPQYMSPEQISGAASHLDRTTDVYSLGISLYEATTLSLPFEAATPAGLYQRIVSSDPPSPRQRNSAIPRDAVVVLEKATDRDPRRRYASALDLAEDLRRVRELEPVLARRAGPVLRLRRWAQRNPGFGVSAIAVVLSLASGLSFFALFQETPSSPLDGSYRNAADLTGSSEAFEFFQRANNLRSRSHQEIDLLDAVRLYERAVELDPDFAVAWAKLSWTHSAIYVLAIDRTERRSQLAWSTVERARELAPDHPDVHQALGFYHYRGLDYERALRSYERALESRRGSVELLKSIAFLERRRGNWERARDYLIEVQELDPRSAGVDFELGHTFRMLRDWASAERHYNAAISQAPDALWPYTNLIYVSVRRDESTRRAREVLDQAATRLENSDWLISCRAHLDALDRDYESATRLLSTIDQEMFDDQFWCRPRSLSLALLYSRQGEESLARTHFESSRETLEELSHRHPEDERYASALGITFAGLGQRERAIEEALRGVELMPLSRDAWRGGHRLCEAAAVYAVVGEHDRAVEVIGELLEIPSPMSRAELRISPTWDPLRGHPGFEELVKASD